MYKWMILICSVSIAAMTMACGAKSVVVLVPDPDGYVGKISVSNEAGAVDIDKPNQQTVVRGSKSAPYKPRSVDPVKIERMFKAALDSQPLPPVHFILYFHSDSVALLPQSKQELPGVVSTIDQRMPTNVSVNGHSDTQGDKPYNLALSLRRAEAVKKQLVELGVPPDAIEVYSHGEENPLVKTADNVANARNRRVEVVVR
jgi:outer membrane protein OmpA-like peptidoglycan-associated protein